jgi:hypothetical protein
MATPKRLNTPGVLQGVARITRPLKMVKMIQARCQECNPHGQARRGWQEKCDHDPYFSMQPAGPPLPQYEEAEDGTFTLKLGPDGEPIKVPQRFVKKPNWVQIADDVKVTSGRMVRIQLERGAKFPEDLGFPSLCDFFNCWEPNPEYHATNAVQHEGVATVIGNYHTRDEAAVMTLYLKGTPMYVTTSGGKFAEGVPGTDAERFRNQIDNVPVPAPTKTKRA